MLGPWLCFRGTGNKPGLRLWLALWAVKADQNIVFVVTTFAPAMMPNAPTQLVIVAHLLHTLRCQLVDDYCSVIGHGVF